MTLEQWLKETPADYYDCRDPEQLTHESAEEAVLEYIEFHDDGYTAAQDFGEFWRNGDYTIWVTAYRRKEVTDAEVKRWANQALEDIQQNLEEEYGNPDGDDPVLDLKKFEDKMLALVQEMVKGANIWGCEPVSMYSLTDDEVIAIVREANPEWFHQAKDEHDQVPE